MPFLFTESCVLFYLLSIEYRQLLRHRPSLCRAHIQIILKFSKPAAFLDASIIWAVLQWSLTAYVNHTAVVDGKYQAFRTVSVYVAGPFPSENFMLIFVSF